MSWQPYNEKTKFGKDATVISEDNIEYAKMRREARHAVKRGEGTPAQIECVNEERRLIRQLGEDTQGGA